VEHVHVLAASSGKLPGTTLPKVLKGAVNPFKRAMLFRPRLVLYLNQPQWEPAFRSPCYPVVLGRSQDLFTYTSVGVTELVETDQAYFEHTLGPYRIAIESSQGYVVLMPRYLHYEGGRVPTFARYVVLERRVHSTDFVRFANLPRDSHYWTDPESPQDKGAHMGLFFHTFVGEYDDRPFVA